jgi:hypothetical protein
VSKVLDPDGKANLVLQEVNGPSLSIQVRPTKTVFILPRVDGLINGSELKIANETDSVLHERYGGFIYIERNVVQLHLLVKYYEEWLVYNHNGTYSTK